jgi:phosphotriesterase-related protein
MPGSAVTVLGEVDAATLGVTLPHEHVLWRSHSVDRPTAEQARLRTRGDEPVTLELARELERNPFVTSDNLRQEDVALAAAELALLRGAAVSTGVGAATVVDVTCVGLGRRAAGLRDVARQSGVTIVAATGYYLAGTHPAEVAARSVNELAMMFINDLCEGIDGTTVRAGIIGELGVGQPMYAEPADGPADRAHIAPDEIRVLEAAAEAHRATGAPISVHLWNFGPNALARRALDILEAAGVDPARVAVGHLDAHCDLAVMREVARRGAFVELDAFGVTAYEEWDASHFDTDEVRTDALLTLLSEGFGDRVLISQDVCTKAQLRAFGGRGYDHIERTLVPELRARGVSEAELAALRIGNPARLLAWAT